MTGLVDYLPEHVDPNCGVYMIRNMRNGKKYIGSTKNAVSRKLEHFKDLSAGKHHSTYLQNAWDAEKNPSTFSFIIFIFCEEKDLLRLEQGCIDTMSPVYNMSKIAGRIEYTPEVIAKMRRIRLEFLASPEGERFRENARDKTLSWLNTVEGKHWSKVNGEAHSDRMSDYWKSDRSNEHRKELSERWIGGNNPSTDERIKLLRRQQLKDKNPAKDPSFSKTHSKTMSALFSDPQKREKYLFHWWWQANVRNKTYWGA
jgi:group I intron endonuclease